MTLCCRYRTIIVFKGHTLKYQRCFGGLMHRCDSWSWLPRASGERGCLQSIADKARRHCCISQTAASVQGCCTFGHRCTKTCCMDPQACLPTSLTAADSASPGLLPSAAERGMPGPEMPALCVIPWLRLLMQLADTMQDTCCYEQHLVYSACGSCIFRRPVLTSHSWYWPAFTRLCASCTSMCPALCTFCVSAL